MAFTSRSTDASTAAFIRKAEMSLLITSTGMSLMGALFFSTSEAMADIAFTDSRGYAPMAVSPLSIMASAWSYMALATSFTSALVGLGSSIMLWSIWVAMITGFLFRMHLSTSIF